MKDIVRNVSMICSFCGNDQFSAIGCDLEDLKDADDETLVKCSDCGRVISKAQLLKENQERIDANIEDVKNEAINELEKELKKMLKKLR